jgi:uncharacterized protein (DUF1499 family)
VKPATWERLGRLAVGAGLAGAGTVLLGPFAYRVGAIGLKPAFLLLSVGAWIGLAGAALGATCAVRAARRGTKGGGVRWAVAIVSGAAAFGVPFAFSLKARSMPMIHDITTDTGSPPLFREALVERARTGAPNSAEYEGPAIARQQREAYPDIQPLILTRPPAEVFARALAAARDAGWEILSAEAAELRIEATATTAIWGFKDDIAIRLRPDGIGTRVDVRSASRVGKSDVGANAARIRKYLAALAK